MAIFGRRRIKKVKKKKKEFAPPVDVQNIPANANMQNIPSEQLVANVKQELKGIEDIPENLAPVFVKVSKYRDILNSVNYLKMGFNLIKNQIAILSKLQKLQKENMELIYAVLGRVSTQLNKLDSDFTKPVDFIKEVSEMEVEEANELKKTISDLKIQIDRLRSEVEIIS